MRPFTRTRRTRLRAAVAVGAAGALLLGTASAAVADHTLPSNVCPAPDGNETFDDVDDGTFADTIECMGGYGITEGFPDGEYKPDRSITRGQMAQFIFELIETAEPGTLDSSAPDAFDDDDESPFETAINALADAGIVQGTGGDDYSPAQNVKRGEMAAFIHNAIVAVTGNSLVDSENTDDDTNGNDDEDAFTDDDGSTFEDLINAIAAESIVSGTTETTYSPQEDVNRGQMSQFIMAGAAYLDSVGLFAPTADGGQGQDLTDAPELTSAEIANQDADSVDVLYTFDEPVDGRAPAAGCFHLYTFDQADAGDDSGSACEAADTAGGHTGDVNTNATSFDGIQAQTQTGDTSTVLVRFSLDEEETSSISVATVDWDAVRDAENTENLEGAAALQDVAFEPGVTTAPDLESVQEFDAAADTVEFVLDEDVESVDNPTRFFLVENDGTLRTSTAAEVDENQDDVVVATFPEGSITTDQQADTARAALGPDAVSDDEGDTNPTQAITVSGDGDTPMPNLESVSVDDGDDSATYTFDQAVDPLGTADLFQLYDRNGVELPGMAVNDGASSNTVEVDFADGSDLNEYVGASVDADAVEAVTGTQSGEGNEIDSVDLEGAATPDGNTFGPELTGSHVESSGSDDPFTPGDDSELHVVYEFDEDVTLPTSMGGPIEIPVGPSATAGRFFVYDTDGTPTRAVECLDSGGNDTLADNEISCQFGDGNDETVSDGEAATVNDQAVVDDDDNTNIEGAAALQSGAF